MQNAILGVDPGLRVAGYSIIACSSSSAQLIDLGFLEQKSTESIPTRVGCFFDFMNKKIIEHNVSIIALETPFLGKNAQTFLKLGYLRGALYLLSHQKNLRLSEFSPREVKQAVTGFGGAGKDQVARVLFAMYPALQNFKCAVRNDVTDALGVGLCGTYKLNQEKIMARAG
ncbi:crossover junction endodeoxyribonuclease RuvC [Candidatus Babeliales bacterium]|nr:crossover junction endodeoxyribonuclease RuvC [Candidatus Babeliales bacterium]